jgi:ABC-type glycerol-3-phosphate transport system substrate-binding protein
MSVNMRPFEMGVLIFFLIAGIGALIIVSNYEKPPAPEEADVVVISQPVYIWGVLPAANVTPFIAMLAERSDSFEQVRYTYVPPGSLHDNLIRALADDVPPDLLLFSHEQLAELRGRIEPLPPEVFPERDFLDKYVDGAQVFALSDGVYAFPFAVDPIVMYWNRDQMVDKGYLSPPATWEELVNDYFPNFIERDDFRTINKSVVAFGAYDNVRNAYGVLSTLLLQGGSAMVRETYDGYTIGLNQMNGDVGSPLTDAIDFYTRFSKPDNSLYSWNNAFPEDRTMFAGEDLVFYFGYGSEASELLRQNPNLNFDITAVPQGGGDTLRRTYGNFYGFTRVRGARNPADALTVLSVLAGASIGGEIAKYAGMAPAYRGLVAAGSDDTYGRVIYESAIIARGWINPSHAQTQLVMSDSIAGVNENRFSPSSAASNMTGQISALY